MLSSPYKDTELYARVLIKSSQIDNDIYINLKNNLKKKTENKCNKYGLITKIYKILDHSDGEIVPENFDASVIYNVRFSCRLCLPEVNTNIICKIDLLNKSLVKASNGPIVCIIGFNYINNDIFNINNKGEIVEIKTGNKIDINTNIIINIRAINFFPDDERIVILGSLVNIPNKNEITTYFNENFNTESIIETQIDDITENDSNSSSINMDNNDYVNL